MQFVAAYAILAKIIKIQWTPHILHSRRKHSIHSDKSELDALIAVTRSERMATYPQCLQETFSDPSEVLRLRWIDVSGNTITINTGTLVIFPYRRSRGRIGVNVTGPKQPLMPIVSLFYL